MKEFLCPDTFKKFVETCSVFELVQLINDLKTHPEDKEYLLTAQNKMNSLARANKENYR